MTDATDRPAKGEIVLEAFGLRKTYGYIVAVAGVDLAIRAGEVLAIVGDNGAGKSTVIKMLCGATVPDSGEVQIAGGSRRKAIGSAHDARELGIETVFQDLALAPNRDVVGNLFLGRELCYGGLARTLKILNQREMKRRAGDQLGALEVKIPKISGVPIGTMSGGQRQSVAIARAAFWASKILLMDEPTAALGLREASAVLRLVRRVAESGVAVVMVSHVMPHVLELADRVIVMRHGQKVAELDDGNFNQRHLVGLIVGLEEGDPDAIAELETPDASKKSLA